MTTGKKESKLYKDLDRFYPVREKQVNKPKKKLIDAIFRQTSVIVVFSKTSFSSRAELHKL